jgi:hypothetical protein
MALLHPIVGACADILLSLHKERRPSNERRRRFAINACAAHLFANSFWDLYPIFFTINIQPKQQNNDRSTNISWSLPINIHR